MVSFIDYTYKMYISVRTFPVLGIMRIPIQSSDACRKSWLSLYRKRWPGKPSFQKLVSCEASPNLGAVHGAVPPLGRSYSTTVFFSSSFPSLGACPPPQKKIGIVVCLKRKSFSKSQSFIHFKNFSFVSLICNIKMASSFNSK